MRHRVSAELERYLHCTYSNSFPRRQDLLPDEPTLFRRLLALYESPESLRDVLLVDVAHLQQLSREEIPKRVNVYVSDQSGMPFGLPPYDVPASSLDDATLEKLLDKMLEALSRRENLVRENYRHMHAALLRALPIDEVLRD